MITRWLAHGGPEGLGLSVEARVTAVDDPEHPVKWKGVVAAIYTQHWKDSGRDPKNPYHCEEKLVAYLTLTDVKALLESMGPLAGPADAPLPPAISGPERESWKTQEGPGA